MLWGQEIGIPHLMQMSIIIVAGDMNE